MRRLIDGDALYEKACDLEAQALDYAVKISNDEEKREEWLKWSTILTERTAFKHDVYDAPTVEPEPQWIPCSERLPEVNGDYLVTGRQGAVNKRKYEDGRWYENWAVLAWMELPAPYKEDTE